MLTHRERKKVRMLKCLKKLKVAARKIRRARNENAELRKKNANVILELQNQRIKCSSLYNDMNCLQSENFNILDSVISSRGNQLVLVDEVTHVESYLRDLAAAMIQASSVLGKIQISCSKIKAQVLPSSEDQHPLSEGNSTDLNLSARTALSFKERRMMRTNQENVLKNLRENLEVIEEVSYENSVSPMLNSKDGSRYERKCKKGLRHLFSTRSKLKCTRKSVKHDDSINKSPSKEVAENLNTHDMSLDESIRDVVPECPSVVVTACTEDVSSSEPTPKSEISLVNDTDTSQSSKVSTPNISRKSLRYSDVVKSSNGSAEKTDKTSVENKLLSSALNVELTTLESSKNKILDESSLSSITVRRGTNRHFNVSETSVSSTNNLSSCNTTPVKRSCAVKLSTSNIPIPADDESDLESGGFITYRRQYKPRSTFTFFSDPEWTSQSSHSRRISENESTIKAVLEDKENNETVISGTKKKKKEKKEKKEKKSKKTTLSTDVNNSLNRTCQNLMNKNSPNLGKASFSASKIANSTPIDSIKPSGKKRQPLETIASSTRISANDSKLSNNKYNFNMSDSIYSVSPILNCPRAQNSTYCDELAGNSFENSHLTNDDSSSCNQRPRRNAAKNTNYKEPPMNVKLRRK